MNVLLDTCALLALASGRLPRRAAAALRRAPEAYVSVVSPWEIAIKAAAGRVRLRDTPFGWYAGVVEHHALREVSLDADLACAAAALPPLHRDPFDRVIVALAQARAVPVLTSDENIARYPGVRTLW